MRTHVIYYVTEREEGSCVYEGFLGETHMVMLWAWGMISPQMLQHTMLLFQRDMQRRDDGTFDQKIVDMLAALGRRGAIPSNIHRDLSRAMPVPSMPAPHSFIVPLKHSVLGFMHKSLDMLLPHELFSAIYHYYPAAWRDCICPSVDRLGLFWRSVQSGPHFGGHPVRHRENFRSKCVPLSLHGDGTPAMGVGKAWSKMIDVWSWSSVLVTGPTVLNVFFIFCVHTVLQCTREGHDTLGVCFKKMVWSFTCLWNGTWPTTDWNGMPIHDSRAGTPLAGGFFAAIWVLLGDLDYVAKDLRLPNSNSLAPCCLCPANSSTIPWYDFRLSARWLREIYTEHAWRASGWAVCEIFKIPGVSQHSCYPDWMHAKHLGSDKVLLGSVLYLLVNFILPGEPETNLSVVWAGIQLFYSQNHVGNPFGNLKLTMFTARSTPKLKGKAAEVRDLGHALHHVFKLHMNTALQLHRRIELCMRLGAHLDDILAEHPDCFVLPPLVAADFVSSGFMHLELFMQLREHFQIEAYPLFQLTSKGHYVMHSCLLARFLNPRLAWCYSGEDFMGKVRHLALSCSKGCQPWQVSNKMLQKYIVALHLTLTDPRAWLWRTA